MFFSRLRSRDKTLQNLSSPHFLPTVNEIEEGTLCDAYLSRNASNDLTSAVLYTSKTETLKIVTFYRRDPFHRIV